MGYMSGIINQVDHSNWQIRIKREIDSLTAFNNVVEKIKEKKPSSAKKGIDPFRTTLGGKFFFYDKTAHNPSDPHSFNDRGAMPYCVPQYDTVSNMKTERSKTLTKKSRNSSVAQLSNVARSKQDFIGNLIKRTNAKDVHDLLNKVKEQLKDYEPENDESVPDNDKAQLVKTLKRELENQSKAKMKAIDILNKLKLGSKLNGKEGYTN